MNDQINKKFLILENSLDIQPLITTRDVFRLAAQKGLISEHRPWFDYQNKRNITVHEYYDEIEKKVYPILPNFLQDLDKLIAKLKQLK